MTNFKISEILMQAGDQKPEYQLEWPYRCKVTNLNCIKAGHTGITISHFFEPYTTLQGAKTRHATTNPP